MTLRTPDPHNDYGRRFTAAIELVRSGNVSFLVGSGGDLRIRRVTPGRVIAGVALPDTVQEWSPFKAGVKAPKERGL